jgi:hypothetical protein
VKVPIYAREKVSHVWLVDPLLQTLEVLRLDRPGYRLAGVWRGDVVVQCEPFEALSIPTHRLVVSVRRNARHTVRPRPT